MCIKKQNPKHKAKMKKKEKKMYSHMLSTYCVSIVNVFRSAVWCNDSNVHAKHAYTCFLFKTSRRFFIRLCFLESSVIWSWSLTVIWPFWNISSAMTRGSSTLSSRWKCLFSISSVIEYEDVLSVEPEIFVKKLF